MKTAGQAPAVHADKRSTTQPLLDARSWHRARALAAVEAHRQAKANNNIVAAGAWLTVAQFHTDAVLAARR